MRAVRVSSNWITRRNYDLLWYVGACVTSYAMIFFNIGLGVSTMMLWWIWIVSFDGPHIFATISRTYLDREEWRSRGPLLMGSLLWFVLGPMVLAASVASSSKMPFFIFLTFAQLWAYWHVVRQHYGFMVLYQKKNGESAGKENFVDYWFFYILMLAPFFSFILRHPEARNQVGLPVSPATAETLVLNGLHGIIFAAIVLYAGKQILNLGDGGKLNLPKNLFFLACIPLHMVIFLHPYISTQIDIRLFTVFVTVYHNIQYHGIVWFYNRNRYGADITGDRFGLASKVSRSFLTYYMAGILFTLVYRYADWTFIGAMVPFGIGPNLVSEFPLGSLFSISDLAIGLWWGFAFNHYYLDQKIWKVSIDRRLNRDLRLET
ncbi:MAG: hypothetical protein VX822_01075 [Candidatus Neomarinimicrobiota bacterium]|nr:hypothetical protein [Candidatus Neomarinimicrobiota bacterium]